MKTEALSVDKEEIRDRGLGEALVGAAGPSDGAERTVEAGKSVFEGFTANRRSCVECGYTEAVMHFTFDNITLPIPHQVRKNSVSPFVSGHDRAKHASINRQAARSRTASPITPNSRS